MLDSSYKQNKFCLYEIWNGGIYNVILKYQKQNPEFLNNYLKYKAYIEFKSKTTANETYFDLRTLFRYIKLFLYNEDKIYTITPEEFRTITIVDVTIADLNKITQNNFRKNTLYSWVTH